MRFLKMKVNFSGVVINCKFWLGLLEVTICKALITILRGNKYLEVLIIKTNEQT